MNKRFMAAMVSFLFFLSAPWLIPKLAFLRLCIYQKFGPVYAKRVARAKWNLEERWEEDNPHRDTALGNLIADAIRIGVERGIENGEISLPWESPLFVIEPNGYIGHRIYKGKVVGNDIMRSIPYGYDPASGLGYRIQLVPLLGLQILGGLELTVSQVEYTDDLSLQVSGLEFEYDSDQPSLPIEEIIAGNLSRLDPFSVRIQGQPIDFTAPYYGLYWVAMNERVVELLGSFGLEPIYDVIPTGLFEYELVHDYMRELKKLTYTSEGRIIDTAK
jgi:2',3'-cyclic-nucleotide 2'-phosphodiesterase (5'-nucleotidase family)